MILRERRRRQETLVGARARAADRRGGDRRGDSGDLRRGLRRPAAVARETVDYTKQRRQFGVPISHFSGAATPHGRYVHSARAGHVDDGHGHPQADEDEVERAKAVSAAKAQIGQACKFIGQNAIQLHGGMGMTDELRSATTSSERS